MSVRSEISKALLQVLGPGLWKDFWIGLAAQVKAKEAAYKGRPGLGKLKADEVKAWAHSRIAPVLPNFAEATIFAYLDSVLNPLIDKLNEAIGDDWVSEVEHAEHLFATYLEPLLDVDLDGDGVVGSGPAKIGAALFLVFLLSHPGPCKAIDHQGPSRPLVEHNRFDETTGLPVPPPADAPRPQSADRPPAGTSSMATSPLQSMTAGTWTGFTTNGRGHDSWNGGLAVTFKAGTFQPSFLAGKGGVGAGIAYRRVGVMAFWDGTLTGGVYLRPFDL